jgi:flagellar biogenesis protein FliO
MLNYFNKTSSRVNAPFGAMSAFIHKILPALGRRSALNGALEHLASLPLTAQSSLALVRLHHETLLLGITPQSITLLSKDQDPESGSPRSGADEAGCRNDTGATELASK